MKCPQVMSHDFKEIFFHFLSMFFLYFCLSAVYHFRLFFPKRVLPLLASSAEEMNFWFTGIASLREGKEAPSLSPRLEFPSQMKSDRRPSPVLKGVASFSILPTPNQNIITRDASLTVSSVPPQFGNSINSISGLSSSSSSSNTDNSINSKAFTENINQPETEGEFANVELSQHISELENLVSQMPEMTPFIRPQIIKLSSWVDMVKIEEDAEVRARGETLNLNQMGQWMPNHGQVNHILEHNTPVFMKSDQKKKTVKTKTQSVFGMKLEDIYEVTNIPVPIVVAQCIHYLKHSGGLKLEGIFRESALHQEVSRIITLYRNPITFVNLEVETQDPHVIACVFKQFFARLPEPLIPYNETDNLVLTYEQYVSNKSELCASFANILKRIPFLSALLLRFLVQFLSQIVIYTKVNKMTADNLAIVFGPNLIRFKTNSMEVMGRGIESKIVALFIEYYDDIFRDVAEVQ